LTISVCEWEHWKEYNCKLNLILKEFGGSIPLNVSQLDFFKIVVLEQGQKTGKRHCPRASFTQMKAIISM
jgi:hypothetical protein